MKNRLILLAALCAPAFAQDPETPPPGTERTVTETVTPGQRVVEETVVERHDPAPPPPVHQRVEEETVERREPVERPVQSGDFDPGPQLSRVPRAVPAHQPGEATAYPGKKTTDTTETTTTTQAGGRVYNSERSVVVVEGRELPYITVPVLFVRETAELLDSESRAALDKTAAAIHSVLRSEPEASFEIEGHTSTDGTDEFNMTLSKERAQRIYDELTRRYEVPARALSAHGYGEMYPKYPNGNEAQLTLDRRVLVVRVR